jgi:hypothetical protein
VLFNRCTSIWGFVEKLVCRGPANGRDHALWPAATARWGPRHRLDAADQLLGARTEPRPDLSPGDDLDQSSTWFSQMLRRRSSGMISRYALKAWTEAHADGVTA